MSEVVSRRQFLKMAGVLGAAAAVTGGASAAYAAASDSSKGGSRTTGRAFRSMPTSCQLCQARCGLLAFLDDERLVKVEGNPEHPSNYGRICAKAQAATNLVYNQDRLLYPMRRVGERGEGKWQRISWGEALDTLAGKLRELRSAGHPERFVFQGGTMATPRFVRRFLDAYGTTNGFLSTPNTDTSRRLAWSRAWGAEDAVADVARSRYVLNFGSNPYENHWYHLPLVQRLVDARNSGYARLVTFDVRLTRTGGKSDDWFPLTPGTDGLVALAMANVIMQEGLGDEVFLSRWSNCSAAEIRDHLAQYTPEMAEAESGVPGADIRRIAREFARARPAVAISGTGVTMREHGTENERCIFLLNAITGNIDVPGGLCLPRTHKMLEPDPMPEPPGEVSDKGALPPSPHTVLSMIAGGELKVGVYMCYMFNPAYSNADSKTAAEVLKDESLIPYLVSVDLLPSETAAMADLVLPDTTFLERWDLESVPSFDMIPMVALRQPVVKSPGEAAPFHDVCIELGRRVAGGMEKYFAFRTAQDYIKSVASKIPGLHQAGGFEYLREHGVWYDAKLGPQYRSYESGGFATRSGKLELKWEDLQGGSGSSLPGYSPENGIQSAGNDDLVFVTFKFAALTSSLAASKWLSEIVHGNELLMNTSAGASRGIKTGDMVEIKSSVGSVLMKVRLTQGIHPRVVASPTGTGHWGLGAVAEGRKVRTKDPDSAKLWWAKEGLGPHPNVIIKSVKDPVGNGQAWHGTVVKVTKTGSAG